MFRRVALLAGILLGQFTVGMAFILRWYDDVPRPYVTIIFAAGLILAVLCWRRYDYHYREVPCGLIVRMDTRGGGLLPLKWFVRVDGQTRAGKRRRYWWRISGGLWRELAVGDTLDLEDDEVKREA